MVVLIAPPVIFPFLNQNEERLDYNSYKKRISMCANCGGYGHLYKSCNHPVISYGIICYKLVYEAHSVIPMFLMVQRKDSLSYVEFIRGKYNLENRSYIMRLATNMTDEERQFMLNNDFDVLWKNMWCKSNEDETNKNFTKEYTEASEKFNMLKKGYLMKTEQGEMINFSIKYMIENTTAIFLETEWGFPKGRRNINEDDISCALREFKEESGVNLKNIRLLNDIKPLEEVFSGSNKIRYKHVYYLSRYVSDYDISYQFCKEIKDVKWFTFDEMIEHIRPYNVERRELAKRVMNVIIRRMHCRGI